MDVHGSASQQVIAELIGMGFEFTDIEEALKNVGPNLEAAIEFILNVSHSNDDNLSTGYKSNTRSGKLLGKRDSSSLLPSNRMKQLSILDHLQSGNRMKKGKIFIKSDVLDLESNNLARSLKISNEHNLPTHSSSYAIPMTSITSTDYKEEDTICDWEDRANYLLKKHFRYPSLKSFQKEALAAWLAHKDCLVLAATGSGKSLCFQIPALLTGKVVVVISPLISLMHDQCLKLSKHGVSACFLGSGQIDHSVEQKAMSGTYDIIYVCPETILRLIKPLQTLAENRGITLFAIDEVHCVSKWGHDFRPDYRRLSVLRENFRADNLKFLKFDIPLMALTATATLCVREDILKSLCMSEETRIVLTSFFRPNLRFKVKHSRTTKSSYEKDFHELISIYSKKKTLGKVLDTFSQDLDYVCDSNSMSNGSTSEENDEDDVCTENYVEASLHEKNRSNASNQLKMSVEYLEDECDQFLGVDDFDVNCGEFCGQAPRENWDICRLSETINLPRKPDEKRNPLQEPLDEGPTIIYVPTRKETLSIAKFLLKFGVKAAAYNAKLPKSHLRKVHKEFHEDILQVVVATIAFGMGIDKLNVRRVIHYGWPQSLEAYYQEAGRAGRDGKLSDCVLCVNQSRTPTLLPSQRSEEQTKKAYKLLSDCFRFGVQTSKCRAKTLVEYFGEVFIHDKCHLCDVCIKGPPELQNLKDEAKIFIQVIAAHYRQNSFVDHGCIYKNNKHGIFIEKPNVKMFVQRIREQFEKFAASDIPWWCGLARLLEDRRFIKEADEKNHVQIRFPEPTELGLNFFKSEPDQPFLVYPEADMLLSKISPKPFSTFAEWGKGWADPDIRHQRLGRTQSRKRPKKRRSRGNQPDLRTARGRLTAKLSKQK